MGLGSKMFHGFAWSALDRISIQGVQFLLGIILARILTPKEYGIIGILLVFIAISNVFIDSGFTKALIQKKDRSQDDITTVFFFNIGISIVCYSLLWVSAPFIAQFYELETLSDLLKVLALSLVINALFAVPITLFTIALDFKTLTKVNLTATIIAGGIAIYMAYSGFGVWALIAQILIKSSITALLVWVFIEWRPNWKFSKKSFTQMFSYGSNLLISSLLNTVVNNFSSLFIAKVISTKELGFYTRGTQFSDFTFSLINSIIERVLLPGLAVIQDERKVLVSHTRKIIKATALLIIPIFIFLAIMAKPIISFLLTDKWLPAVPIMQIFCIARLITIISGVNVNLLYVLGRTDLALKQQTLKIVVRVLLLLAAIKFGIIYVALAELFSTSIHFFINTHYPGKIMKYGAFAQIKDLKKIIWSGLLMGFAVFWPVYYIESDILNLIITPILAIIVYLVAIKYFKIEEFDMILNQIKLFLIKTKSKNE